MVIKPWWTMPTCVVLLWQHLGKIPWVCSYFRLLQHALFRYLGFGPIHSMKFHHHLKSESPLPPPTQAAASRNGGRSVNHQLLAYPPLPLLLPSSSTPHSVLGQGESKKREPSPYWTRQAAVLSLADHLISSLSRGSHRLDSKVLHQQEGGL